MTAAIVHGQSSEGESAFRDAMRPYATGDYEMAMQHLRDVTSAHPDYSPARFFLGACELLLNQPGPALADMKRVLEDRETPFKKEAQWAMAQEYLFKNDAAQAKSSLTAISAGGGDIDATGLRRNCCEGWEISFMRCAWLLCAVLVAAAHAQTFDQQSARVTDSILKMEYARAQSLAEALTPDSELHSAEASEQLVFERFRWERAERSR